MSITQCQIVLNLTELRCKFFLNWIRFHSTFMSEIWYNIWFIYNIKRERILINWETNLFRKNVRLSGRVAELTAVLHSLCAPQTTDCYLMTAISHANFEDLSSTINEYVERGVGRCVWNIILFAIFQLFTEKIDSHVIVKIRFLVRQTGIYLRLKLYFQGIASFIALSSEYNICVAVSEKIMRNAKSEDFDRIIERLSSKHNARGVVIFVDEDNIR